MNDSPVVDAVNGFVEMTPWLWWLSVVFFVVGDLLTTATATVTTALAEGSPTMGVVMANFGLVGFIVIKLAVLALGYATWRVVGHPHNVGVPLALSVLGIGFTTWNLVVIGYTIAG